MKGGGCLGGGDTVCVCGGGGNCIAAERSGMGVRVVQVSAFDQAPELQFDGGGGGGAGVCVCGGGGVWTNVCHTVPDQAPELRLSGVSRSVPAKHLLGVSVCVRGGGVGDDVSCVFQLH